MRVRKNAIHLTATERDNFLRAVLTLKNTIANPAAPPAQQINIYDQFVAIHLYVQAIVPPGAMSSVNMGHNNSGFCPWHRYYLLKFEQALQAVDPTVTLPYWDWTDHANTNVVLLQNNFMGPNGGGGAGGAVQSGYFAFDAPGSGGNPTPLPPWWPAGLAGWRIRPTLAQTVSGSTLRRSLNPFGNLAIQSDVLNALSRTVYQGVAGTGFRATLEASLRMHNDTHNWFGVGSHMSAPSSSPNDPMFFLHHCNVERIWVMWQIDGHQGPAFYDPSMALPSGHKLNDPMWPWVGAAAPTYSSNNAQLNVVLPDTGYPFHSADPNLLCHLLWGFRATN